MKNIINNMVKALTTDSEGYSARKLSAFVIIICVIITHVKWISLGDFDELDMVLAIDYSFIGVCLGMTTYETITKIRTKKGEETSTEEKPQQ